MLSLRLRTLNATWVNPRSDIAHAPWQNFGQNFGQNFAKSMLIPSRGLATLRGPSTRPDYIPPAGLCKASGQPAHPEEGKGPRAATASKVLADAAPRGESLY